MNTQIESLVSQVREYDLPKQAVSNIDTSYELLGLGTGRLVIQLGSDTVCKLSVSQMGDHQNKTEATVWKNASEEARTYLSPVIAVADDYTWVKMKRVTDPTETYTAFETSEEERVRDGLADCGIILNEVEVGRYDGRIVAYDYGNCQNF